MSDAIATPPTGRLMRLLAARGGTVPGEPTMVIQHREALIWTLGKAAALEQLVMCQYLYAAFSIKDRDDYLKKQAEAQFAVPEEELVEAVRGVLARHKA